MYFVYVKFYICSHILIAFLFSLFFMFSNQNEQKIVLNFSNFQKLFKNLNVQFSILCHNYQYLDKHTIFGYLYIFPKYEGKIYSIRKKQSKYTLTLFFITEADIWKINSDQINNFSYSLKLILLNLNSRIQIIITTRTK